jgi:nucleoside-diphosphate-sugar epimerase
MQAKHALIVGATGQIGRAVARHLLARGWAVTGLSRGAPAGMGHPMLQVDLTDAGDCRRKLAGQAALSHLVYAARYDHVAGQPEPADLNTAMLANVLDAIEPVAPGLAHVHLVHGSKYYGHNRAPSAQPFREDLPRGDFENFYFSQEDLLTQRCRGKAWTWSISRPHTFCDFASQESRSIVLAVAVYAALLRAQGLPLVFPGTPAAYAARTQFTWLPLLAQAIEWMGTEPACGNQAFNVVNDDPQPWSVLWPRIAAALSMPLGAPEPTVLARFVEDQHEVWRQLVRQHGLRASELATVVKWPYADYVFSTQWDVVSSMAKARGLGFEGRADSLRMWDAQLAFLADERIIPPLVRSGANAQESPA